MRFPFFALLRLVGDKSFQGRQPVFPELAVVLDPLGRVGHGAGVERKDVVAALHRAPHEFRALEHLDVLGDGVERHRKIAGDLGDAGVGQREAREDGAPRRVGHGAEGGVEPAGGLGDLERDLYSTIKLNIKDD